MKILITSDSYLPRLGGAEIHALKLGIFLQRARHEVRLFTSEKMEGKDDLSTFPVIRQKGCRNLWREVRNADLVYSIYCHKIAAAVGFITFFIKKPLVVSLQGRGILNLPGNNWFYAKVHSAYRSFSLKRADKVFAAALEFVDIAKKYTSAKKISYFPNAIDVSEFNLRPKSASLLNPSFVGKKIVATIRRLVPKNGVQFLIEAIPYVIKEYRNVIFYVIGWGRLENYLKKRVQELGISDYVYFAGRINNDILPGYLNLADLVVFPSTAEATSIACLESMALGKPILASKVGGYPEMIKDNYNGFLVNLTDRLKSDYNAPMTLPEEKLLDLSNKIVSMIQNEKLLRRFGENSRYSAESKFSWQKRITEFIPIFEELVNKN